MLRRLTLNASSFWFKWRGIFYWQKIFVKTAFLYIRTVQHSWTLWIWIKRLVSGTSLPSINYLSRAYNVSRDTVFKAFSDLRERKLIDSTPGKGYYVTNRQEKIFLLLDEYSPFKNTLYNSFVRKLSTSYKVDLWFSSVQWTYFQYSIAWSHRAVQLLCGDEFWQWEVLASFQ